MKKLIRSACLLTVLVLSGVASAGADPYVGLCHTECGYTVFTDYESCCAHLYQCSDGNYGQGLIWDFNGGNYYCLITGG